MLELSFEHLGMSVYEGLNNFTVGTHVLETKTYCNVIRTVAVTFRRARFTAGLPVLVGITNSELRIWAAE